jgi:hypothetical protein
VEGSDPAGADQGDSDGPDFADRVLTVTHGYSWDLLIDRSSPSMVACRWLRV